MSVIRKKPYIEALLATMSDANLKDLHVVLNSGGDNVSLDFEHLTNDYKNKVTPVYFQLEDCNLKTGILIWTNSKCALICYHRFQDLIIYELSPTYHTFTKINEYCDINELRRVLDDTLETKGTIESGDAEEGALPFADGEGGATWDKPVDYIKGSDFPDGTTSVKMIAIDDDGDLVKVDIPEGTVVVDSALSDSSENPVQNKVITDAINDIEEDITEINGELETKANVDGNYPTMTVGAADNLTPYDESAGDDQDDPFLFQATGTGNGSQADFATGALALMKEKRGNSVVVNQLINPNNLPSTTTVNGVTFTNNGDGTITINGTATGGDAEINVYGVFDNIRGHKVISIGNTDEIKIYDGYNYLNITGFISLFTVNQNANLLYILIANGNTVNNVTIKPMLIDLTQWFNGDIPADLLAHPENFFRYYQGSLAYNTGTIVNANSRYIKCIGRQQWDEETEIYATNRIASKYPIKVIPNTKYHFRTNNYFIEELDSCDINGSNKKALAFNIKDGEFIIPSDVQYIWFYMESSYGTTYNHDITISLYYSGESGYDQYYAYEVLTNNDTGTEVLRSAGSVYDSKLPSGEITRKVGYIDLGTLEWSYSNTEGHKYFYTNIVDIVVGQSTGIPNIRCSKYVADTDGNVYNDINDKTMSIMATQQRIFIYDTAYTDATTFKNAMSGVILNYELATPTTEQGTPFSENLVIDDFGSMEFAGTSGVPQGNLIFYPVDYKAFVDTLYDYTEGTPSDIALKSDLVGLVEQSDLSSGIVDSAGLTYLVKKAYKTGNIVTLTILATNETGSSINAATTLFTISSSLRPISSSNFSYAKGLSNDICVVYSSGDVAIASALDNNASININVTYAVA